MLWAEGNVILSVFASPQIKNCIKCVRVKKNLDKIINKLGDMYILTTLNTAHVAISAFDIKNIAKRIKRLLAITWPDPLLSNSDSFDICE